MKLRLAYLLPAVLAISSCATPAGQPGALQDVGPGARPALETDEAGLWMQSDRFEKALSTSGDRVRDEALNQYLQSIVCKLSAEHCADVRVYVLDVPYLNAFMVPNGTMAVWTGLLLRVQNEAQLAAVLGHELAHYLRRHSIQQWRDTRLKSDLLVFLQLATAAAGVGYVGSVGQLIALGSVLAFSRDQEREADGFGFRLLTNAGYAPGEAANLWRAVLEEKEASDDSGSAVFLSTHPATDERIAVLDKLSVQSGGGGDTRRDAYVAAVARWRGEWLRKELRKREYDGSQVVIDRLLEADPTSGELYFFQGELRRLRGEDGDVEQAMKDYERALRTNTAPPEAHRSLGLLLLKTGRKAEAATAFERYLELEPDATDQKMIRFYINQIE